MSEILERLVDLHKQATEERSHYYVGKCVRDAISTISDQEMMIAALEADLERVQCELDEAEISLTSERQRREGAEAALQLIIEEWNSQGRLVDTFTSDRMNAVIDNAMFILERQPQMTARYLTMLAALADAGIAEIGAYRWLEARPVFSLQLELVALVFIWLAALMVREKG